MITCWDQAPGNAKSFAEAHRCQAASSLDDLLADPRVEGVAIFTPNNFHRGPAEAAAAAGKHVFTEKPIANTVADGAAIFRACAKAGVTLMVGHSSRYQGPPRALKTLLDSGRLGQIAMVEANHAHAGGTRVTEKEWRWHRDQAPGGPLMQLAVHDFDTLHYLFGPTKRVTALSTSKLVDSEIEDIFLTLLEFESGLLGYVGTSYVSPPSNFTRIYGIGGNAYAEGGEIVLTKMKGSWETEKETIVPPVVKHTAAEMTEFASGAKRHARGDQRPGGSAGAGRGARLLDVGGAGVRGRGEGGAGRGGGADLAADREGRYPAPEYCRRKAFAMTVRPRADAARMLGSRRSRERLCAVSERLRGCYYLLQRLS